MEQQNGGVDWRTRAAKLFCFVMLLLGVWLILSYAKTLLVVVLIVWGVSAVIDSLARRTAEKIRVPRKLIAVVYLILLLALLGFAVFFALSRLWEELEELAIWMEDNRGMIGQKISEVVESVGKISSYLPWMENAEEVDGLSELGATIDAAVSNFIHESLSEVGTFVTGSLGNILRGTPKALITLVVTVMACFYLSMDYEGFRDRLIALLPPRTGERVENFRQKAGKAVRSYLRAYLLLLLLTFAEVFVGLLILGKSYAFLIAILVAVVDLLPILGAGTVLVPWAIVMLFLKNYHFGFGLLILYGVVTIVRQIAEPHLVGGSLGIHPLVSLAFMFAGLQLFGFFGMILGPAVALVLKELLSSQREKSL